MGPTTRAARATAWFGTGLALIGLGVTLLLASTLEDWAPYLGGVLLFLGTLCVGVSGAIFYGLDAQRADSADGPTAVRPTPPVTTEAAPPTVKVRSSPGIDEQGRVLIDLDPEYLFGLFEGHTSDQVKLLLQPYIGKWTKISGLVQDVNDGQLSLDELEPPFPSGGSPFLYFEPAWADRLAVLKKRQRVTVLGQIAVIYSLGIRLRNCELV